MSMLSIKARMYVNLGVLAVAMLVVCGVALNAFNSSSRRMQQLHAENLVPITQINEIYQRSLQSQQYRLEAYVHRDPAFTQKNFDQVKENRGRINELTEQFSKYPLGQEERRLLVGNSGKSLADIVSGVVKVTEIVAEIAAATSEQSTGIDQINHAIANMDTATQQNAALVEESAAAAKSMQQQAQRLQELVSFFRFGAQGRASYGGGSSNVSYSGGHVGEQQPESYARAA